MSETKGQKAANLWEKVKSMSNLTYVILGVAVLIMICVAAGHYQMPKWKSKYEPINQLPGLLFGCPSLSEKRNDGGVLLSFLDGPYEKITDDILQRLKYNNLTALFFLSPTNAQQYPGLVKEMVARNHQIGVYLNELSTAQGHFEDKLKDAEKTFFNITGDVPRFLKVVNDTIDKTQLEKSRFFGYTLVMTKPVEIDTSEDTTKSEDEIGRQNVKFLFNHLTAGSILCLPHDNAGLELLKSFTEDSTHGKEQHVELLSPKDCFNLS